LNRLGLKRANKKREAALIHTLQTAYHDDFEKSKGKYTQIADDPELLRLVRNQEAVSMVVKVSTFSHQFDFTPFNLPLPCWILLITPFNMPMFYWVLYQMIIVVSNMSTL